MLKTSESLCIEFFLEAARLSVISRNSHSTGRTSEREILLALRHLIAAEISRDVNKVTPETRFPEGLNIR
jgi:hypothetical protein